MAFARIVQRSVLLLAQHPRAQSASRSPSWHLHHALQSSYLRTGVSIAHRSASPARVMWQWLTGGIRSSFNELLEKHRSLRFVLLSSRGLHLRCVRSTSKVLTLTRGHSCPWLIQHRGRPVACGTMVAYSSSHHESVLLIHSACISLVSSYNPRDRCPRRCSARVPHGGLPRS